MANPNVPTFKVEVAFGASWTNTAPTWTDITAYVRNPEGVRIQRGKPNELSTFSSGRCTFVLNNNDGRFAPFNASGPYYPNLLPRTQVRVTATWAATDYVLFRGYIVGWPQSYSKGKKLATVQVEAYDALAILNETVLGDMYSQYQSVGIGSMLASWRVAQNRGLTETVNGVNYSGGTSSMVRSDLVPGLSNFDAIDFDGTFQLSGQTPAGISSSTTTYSVSCWVRMSGASIDDEYILSRSAGSTTGTSLRFLLADGTLRWNANSAADQVSSTISVNDGLVHHVCIVKTAGVSIKMYIDGVDVSTGAVVGTGYPDIGMLGSGGRYVLPYTGDLQAVTIFGKALSSTEVRNLYNIGLGRLVESTAARFGKVLDAAGWPSSWRTITSNPYGVCMDTWDRGATALAQMQLVAATEQGAMFVSKDGNITLLQRYAHQFDSTATTIQATFSDDGSDSPYVEVGYDYDDLNVINSMTISSGSFTATATDSTSIARYGIQDSSISTQLGVYEHNLTMAQGLVYQLKDPKLRARPLALYPQVKTSTWPTILGLDLWQRVRFEITANGVGSQTQTELMLSQMDWYITQSAWELTVNGVAIPTSFGREGSAVLGTDRIGY